MGSHGDHWCLWCDVMSVTWCYICDVMLHPLRYTWLVSLFFQNALVEYIGVCTDTNQGDGSKVLKQWFIAMKSFNCLILAYEAINTPRKCTSRVQTVKIRRGHFLEMFHMWKLWIKLLKFYNGSQWRFYIEKSLFLGGINHCFGNKSQTNPSPWNTFLFTICFCF